MGVMGNENKILFRKPGGKRPLWKPMYRWALAQDRDQWWALVNMVMNLGIP
jgi:hypothetical protein